MYIDQTHIKQMYSNPKFQNLRIAAFFDCDNFSSKYVDFIIERLSEYGEIVSIQAFRDWSVGSDWNNSICIKYPIEPIHTIRYSGKNSTDLRLQRAVLECLYRGAVDCIAIASSDSDFRDLVVHIRSLGTISIGIGREAIPTQGLYHIFIPFPNETKSLEYSTSESSPQPSIPQIGTMKIEEGDQLEVLKIQLLKKTIQNIAIKSPSLVEGGYVSLHILGNELTRIKPDYKKQYFGVKSLKVIFTKEPYSKYFVLKGSGNSFRVKAR